jgi:hypothetical protein
LPLFVFGTGPENEDRKPYISFSFWNMFLLDIFSIYVVGHNRPFYFFDSPNIEKSILLVIMISDVLYDGFVFLILGYNAIYSALEALWYWNLKDEHIFTIIAATASSGIMLCDIYQTYLFIYEYRKDKRFILTI